MGKEIPQIVRFLKHLPGIRMERAILFGSRARGDWLETSDWDLLLVSSDFEGIPFLNRMTQVLSHWGKPVNLEILCYTPEEFEKKARQIGIVQQAIREGKTLLRNKTVRQKAA